MIETALVATALASPVLSGIVAALSNRRKGRVDNAEKLVASAMARMDTTDQRYERLETKYDRLEGDVRDLRRGLFPHQQWDLLAHRKALEVDPDFPAPPELHI